MNSSDFIIKNGVLTEYTGKSAQVILPYEITQIGDAAFYECQTMTQLVIHDRVTSVHEGAFCGCFGLTCITVDQNNKNYKDIDGNLYSKDGKTLVRYALGKKETSFVIPSGVECIGQGAFSDCRNLINVWISNNVINIGDYAFLACIRLDDVKYLMEYKLLAKTHSVIV